VVKISKILAKTSVEDAEKEDGAAKRKSAKRQKEKEKSGRGQKHGKKSGVLAGGLCFFLPWRGAFAQHEARVYARSRSGSICTRQYNRIACFLIFFP
jgi:hypothetical protein